MRLLFTLLCIAVLNCATAVYARSTPHDPVVDQFVSFCMGNVQSAQVIIARPATINWAPASFPAEYRLDASETKLALAWSGTIEDKPYELLITSKIKPEANALMCILRTASNGDAQIHQRGFKAAMQAAGLKLEKSRSPKIYKYNGKAKNGRPVLARLASTLPVLGSKETVRVPNTFYVAMSILHEVN